MLTVRFNIVRPLFSVALLGLLGMPALALSQPSEEVSTGELSVVELSPEKNPEGVDTKVGATDASTETQKVSMGILRASLSKTQLKTLDLQEALQIALEQNPNLKEAHDNSREAKAHYWGSLAGLLPDVGVAYNVGNYKGSVQSLTPTLLKMNRATVSPQLFFRFNLLQGGEQIFRAIYNKRNLEAQRLNEQAEIQDILHETALRYYELERSLADLRAAQEQVAETQENVTASQNRATADNSAALDALQLQTQQSEAEEQLAEAQSASEMAALRLNEMLVLPAFVDTLPTADQQLHTLVPSGTDFQASLTQALENNPSLKAQEKQIKAYEQLLKAAIVTAILPNVQTEYDIGSVGATRDTTGRYDCSSSRIAFTDKNLGVSGVFGYRELKAKMSAMRNQLAEQRNAIQRTLSEAQIKSQARQAQVEIDRQRLALSQKAREAAITQIKDGKAHGLDLLQAQTMLNTARRQMNEAILQYNESQVEIVYAMGVVSVDTLTHGLRPSSTPPTQVSSNLPGN